MRVEETNKRSVLLARRIFTEFIVGTAVGLNPENLKDEWDAYDLTTMKEVRVQSQLTH